MYTSAELDEYRDEIRRQVCARCPGRPEGGPPCTPRGKPCGVELYLPELLEAIHAVHSDLIEPYRASKERHVCDRCAYLKSSACPCPLDDLFVPILQAVEAVDQRRQRHAKGHEFVASLPDREPGSLAEVCRAYEEAAGTWVGCDWTTNFGNSGLDLNGWAAGEAESMAVEATDPDEVEDWQAAAAWLAKVENNAAQAEKQAALAVAAANAGEWGEALDHARRAWLLEFATGRPLWKGLPLAWQPLWQAVKAAAPPTKDKGERMKDESQRRSLV
jgi:hypothetical protein